MSSGAALNELRSGPKFLVLVTHAESIYSAFTLAARASETLSWPAAPYSDAARAVAIHAVATEAKSFFEGEAPFHKAHDRNLRAVSNTCKQ